MSSGGTQTSDNVFPHSEEKESWNALPILRICGSSVERVERSLTWVCVLDVMVDNERLCMQGWGPRHWGRSFKRSETNLLSVSLQKMMGQRTRLCRSERRQSQPPRRDGAVLRQWHPGCH